MVMSCSPTYPTVVRVMSPHQKESRKDQEPAGLSFSAKYTFQTKKEGSMKKVN
jgi:hypothetical protein